MPELNLTELELPYELTLMDLNQLHAKVKKDDFGRYQAEIGNTKFSSLKCNKFGSVAYLKCDLKRQMYYHLLKIGEIRYCTVCEKILILDSRPYIDVCSSCRGKDIEPVISEYVKLTKDYSHKVQAKEEVKSTKSIDEVCQEAKEQTESNPEPLSAEDLFNRISAINAEENNKE
jgi:hypothetical protein